MNISKSLSPISLHNHLSVNNKYKTIDQQISNRGVKLKSWMTQLNYLDENLLSQINIKYKKNNASLNPSSKILKTMFKLDFSTNIPNLIKNSINDVNKEKHQNHITSKFKKIEFFKIKKEVENTNHTDRSKKLEEKRKIKRKVHNLFKNEVHDVCDNFVIKTDNLNDKVIEYMESNLYKNNLVKFHSNLRILTNNKDLRFYTNPSSKITDFEDKKIIVTHQQILNGYFNKKEKKEIFREPIYYVDVNNFNQVMKLREPPLKLVDKLNYEQEFKNKMFKKKLNTKPNYSQINIDNQLAESGGVLSPNNKKTCLFEKVESLELKAKKYLNGTILNNHFQEKQKEINTANILNKLSRNCSNLKIKQMSKSQSVPRFGENVLKIKNLKKSLIEKISYINQKDIFKINENKLKSKQVLTDKISLENCIKQISQIYRSDKK